MGRDVLARLELDGDETVLDAGCGTGKVTAALLERLPNGRVIAVDARAVDGRGGARSGCRPTVDVRQADLLDLELDEPVDAILSTATFHWIADHDRLFAQPARGAQARRPAGRPVRRQGQRRRGQERGPRRSRAARRSPSTSPTGPATGTSPRREDTEARLLQARLHRRLVLAHRGRRRARRRGRLPRRDLLRLVPRAPARGPARGRSSTQVVAELPEPGRARVRAPEHPRAPPVLDSAAAPAARSRAAVCAAHVAAPVPLAPRSPPRRRRLVGAGRARVRLAVAAAVPDRRARRPRRAPADGRGRRRRPPGARPRRRPARLAAPARRSASTRAAASPTSRT